MAIRPLTVTVCNVGHPGQKERGSWETLLSKHAVWSSGCWGLEFLECMFKFRVNSV